MLSYKEKKSTIADGHPDSKSANELSALHKSANELSALHKYEISYKKIHSM